MNTKTVFRVVFAAAIVVLGSVCIAPVAADGTGQQAYVPDHILVRFQDGADSARILAASAVPAETLMDFDTLVPGLQALQLPDGVTVEEAIAYYSSLPGVVYAEPDYYCSFASQPNDPEYSRLWGLKNLSDQGGASAEAAWNITTGDDSIVVAVIDSGVDLEHPDLKDHIWTNQAEYFGLEGVDDDNNGYVDDIHGWNFIVNSSDVMDYNFHGTLCAGIIGAVANNNYGVAGTAWNVTIMPLVALNAAGGATNELAVLAGIKYAVENHADIISMSFGGACVDYQSYHNLINETEERGVVLVAAAGNSYSDNDKTPMWPASFPNANVIAVAASNQTNERPDFSNYGATSVDLAAPGVEIYSTVPLVSTEPGVLDPVTANRTAFGQLGNSWSEEQLPGGAAASLAIHGVNSSVLYYNEPITPKGEQFSLKWNATYRNLTPDESLIYLISIRNFSEYGSVENMLANLSECRPLGSNYEINQSKEEAFAHVWADIQKMLPSPSGKYYFGIYYDSTDADSDVYLRTTTIANNYTVIGHGFIAKNGTSLSTPMVSGTVALIKSVNPNLTPSEIRELLISTVDKFDAWTGVVVSGGRLNITAAVMKARPELDVIFNSTGGSAVPSQKVLYGETAVRPSPDPGKDGYAFEDWYTDTTLSTRWNFDTDVIRVPTTMYANWTVNTSQTVADTNGTAVFGNTNVTAVHSTAGNRISSILLADVGNLTAGTTAEFTADNTTVPGIPDLTGRDRTELAVFELNATVSSGTTAWFTLTVVFSDEATAAETMHDMRIWHYNASADAWDAQPLEYTLTRTNETVTYTVSTASFSPFGMGIYTEIPPQYTPSSSSKQTGSTVILSEGQVVPTVMPTIAPTAKPTEQPVTPAVIETATQATPSSPAPFLGILAGLGAAAVVLRLRK